jgi:hypothetical protein
VRAHCLVHTPCAVTIEMREEPCPAMGRSMVVYSVAGREIGRYMGGSDEYSLLLRSDHFSVPRIIALMAHITRDYVDGTLYAVIPPVPVPPHPDLEPWSPAYHAVEGIRRQVNAAREPRMIFLGHAGGPITPAQRQQDDLALASTVLALAVYGERRPSAEEAALAALLGT